jgi:hypothetical protein
MKRKFLIVLAILAVTSWVGSAQADFVFTLDTPNQPNPNIGNGPYVQVTVQLVDSTHATVTAQALSTYVMGGAGAFDINLAAGVTASVSSVNPSGITFSMDPSPPPPPGFAGSFTTTFSPPNFNPGNQFTSLVISLVNNGGTWDSASAVLLANNKDNFAAAHVTNPSVPGALTYYVAGHGNPVPIPPSALLLGSGLLGIFIFGRRKRG